MFGATDIGQMRENNEDQFLIAKVGRTLEITQTSFQQSAGKQRTEQSPVYLAMVADGMGGHDAGEVASAVAIDAVTHYAFTGLGTSDSRQDVDDKKVQDGLKEAVERSQKKIRRVASRKGLKPDLGTTITMVYVEWPKAHVVHVGDSRAYLHRDEKLYRLTRDHNLAEQMVEMNVISEQEALTSKFSNILTNALGGDNRDVIVEVHRLDLKIGDKIMLCTDGLYGCVGDDRIETLLGNVTSHMFVEPCVDSLIRAANKAGGPDNITAVLAMF